MKLQILVPQYNETEEIIKPLLDSIEIQQSIDLKNDVGVIIVNDGSNIHLSRDFLDKYSYNIDYYLDDHKGVSATRNACLDRATADYVMFCDADDMFYNACGLYIVFREIEMGGFDTLVSVFIEETRDMATNVPIYVNHELDSTFVHGKIHRRQYLIDNNIRWNEKLTIHEDSYFNCLCQKMTTDAKYCEIPFYLWKWRDSSVCRHDPKYILKTYNNMIDSNTELVLQFLQRGKNTEAFTCIALMVYDAYFTMNKNEWLNQENKEYRKNTELRFQEYWLRFRNLFFSTPQEIKNQVVMGTKNRMYAEGLIMESITFEQWIKEIENIH